MLKKILIILVLALILPTTIFAYTSPGKPSGYVNDFANILSSDVKNELEADLVKFEKETTNEVSVVTIKSLNGDDLESYTNTLFREWGIGKKDKNNGVLFLIVVDDRKIRIEPGYGLEGALTDITAQNILDTYVRPEFKNNDYNKGVSEGVRRIEEAIRGEYINYDLEIPAPKEPSWFSKIFSTLGDMLGRVLGVGFFVYWGVQLFIILIAMPFSWLASVLGRSKSWWLGGIIGGIVGLIIAIFSINTRWPWIIFLTIIGLVFDFFVSKNYVAGKKSWWAGGKSGKWDSWGGSWGGGSSGSSGGSSFGGFGGGSSGGGGASSSW